MKNFRAWYLAWCECRELLCRLSHAAGTNFFITFYAKVFGPTQRDPPGNYIGESGPICQSHLENGSRYQRFQRAVQICNCVISGAKFNLILYLGNFLGGTMFN